ncbi:putative Polysaccharide biosynthesis protein [Vibrio nigripulchritudo SO65]|nr:putative Polysaccharide biosynthesis protein [Vibrio nigripulchritudo AM115]CCN44275.1 putative Polysaccharide biosynthesis protein [Vibrio nigripulchritudo FTn2]CCN66956.1 putative Polysaccharide biosynthesis protein [Vibrio nigripulchritudo POn4]CCN74414.1 putative Polysaccharide biosynthesis protein [Vibrio nigripulchritudo SO65]
MRPSQKTQRKLQMNSRVIKLLWIAFEKFGMTIVSIATFFIYAKLLTPLVFGMAVLALSIGQGVAVIFGNLFEDALVQHKDPQSTHFDTAFWGGISISAVLSFSILGICWFLAIDPALFNLIAFSLLHIVLVSVTSLYVAKLRRIGRFDTLAKRSMLSRLVGAGAGIGLVLYGFGSVAVVAQSVIIEIVGLAYLLFVTNHRIGLSFQRKAFFELSSVGWMLCVRRLSWDASIRGIPILLGMTAGTAAVGLFGFAWRIVEMPRSAIASGLLSYALPVFSRRQKQKEELCQLFQLSTKFTAMIVTPLFVGLALVAPTLVPWLFGDKWLDAILPTQIFALVAVISLARIYVPVSFTAVAKPSTALISDLVGTIAALTVTAMFGAAYGAMAAALGMLLRVFVTMPFSMKGYSKIFGLNGFNQIKPVSSAWLASLGMVFAVVISGQFIESSLEVIFLATCLIGAASYVVCMKLVYPSWQQDLRQFLNR